MARYLVSLRRSILPDQLAIYVSPTLLVQAVGCKPNTILTGCLCPPSLQPQARWIKPVLPPKQLEYAIWLVLATGSVALSGLILLVLAYVLRSPTLGWTGVRLFFYFFCGQDKSSFCVQLILFGFVLSNVESSRQLFFEVARRPMEWALCVTHNAHSPILLRVWSARVLRGCSAGIVIVRACGKITMGAATAAAAAAAASCRQLPHSAGRHLRPPLGAHQCFCRCQFCCCCCCCFAQAAP